MVLLNGDTADRNSRIYKEECKKTQNLLKLCHKVTGCLRGKSVRHNENNSPDVDGTVLVFAGQGSEFPGEISYCVQHKFYML